MGSNPRRLRMFAGPNGSGKSTVFDKIQSDFDLGIYLNADEIEKLIRANGEIKLEKYGLSIQHLQHFNSFLKKHTLYKKAINEGFSIDLIFDGKKILNPNGETHSYEASILTDFMRNILIKNNQKLTFETVMSHESKVEMLKKAQEKGYKNYLYFIATIDPEINKSRVEQRVKNGGHPVPLKKIESRYYRSLGLLKDAIKYTHRTFLFDNSGEESRLILEVFEGREVKYWYKEIPSWVDDYFLNAVSVVKEEE